MKPVVLLILDGYGVGPPGPGNAAYNANPTNLNSYLYLYPNTTLKASGESVGLPRGEVGNTEVGHLNIGAGRIVYQDLPRINMSIADGSFYKNPIFLKAIEHLRNTGGKLHIIGLIGTGSVHSNIDHLHALLYFAKEQRLNKVFLHAITDGRDSPPKSASETIKELEDKINKDGICRIATIMGRYFAMDRDHRWERTEKAYLCLTKGVGLRVANAQEAIANTYNSGKTDEFIEPTNIINNEKPMALIEEGDAVIFFNYRIDRPRQLTKAFVLDDFENKANITTSFDPYAIKYHKTHLAAPTNTSAPFRRGEKIKNLLFITMTEYEKSLSAEIAFPLIIVSMPLGRVLSMQGIAQLRMSESEKEKFVTFYFNGHRDLAFPLEDRIIIPSPKVPTYDQKPEMSAFELTNSLIRQIESAKYLFFAVNIANPDMVGHTGSLEASIKAVKVVDECVGKIVSTVLRSDGSVFITADHGNVEQKINPQTGEVSTEHTDNPVPFIAINNKFHGQTRKLQTGILADIAPTILSMMGIQKPNDMSGRNLLEGIHV